MYKYTEPETLKIFYVLPNPWIREGKDTICGLSDENCESYGWLKEEYTPEPAPIHYSKYKLIVNLKEKDIWSEVKQIIEQADFMDEWNACQYLSSDDASFNALLAQMRISFPDVDFDEILANSLWED